MNFKIGQKVVCVYNGDWDATPEQSSRIRFPKKDEQAVISELVKAYEGTYLKLVGFPQSISYLSTYFRPLDELTSYGINDLIETLPFEERKVTVNI